MQPFWSHFFWGHCSSVGDRIKEWRGCSLLRGRGFFCWLFCACWGAGLHVGSVGWGWGGGRPLTAVSRGLGAGLVSTCDDRQAAPSQEGAGGRSGWRWLGIPYVGGHIYCLWWAVSFWPLPDNIVNVPVPSVSAVQLCQGPVKRL